MLFMIVRRSTAPRLRDVGRDQLVNGLVGVLFSVTGGLAVILAVGRTGHLPESVVASWVFAVFALNGTLTIAASLFHRQPLCFFWTMPGAVVVGQALVGGMTWPEVVGVYVLAALLILVVGLTGQVDRIMGLLPMPVVMAMVAGVFLKFGLELVLAVDRDVAIAAPMVLAFLACSAVPGLDRWVPPILAALLTGVAVTLLSGRVAEGAVDGRWLASPAWQEPVFTWSAAAELVVPLAITVLVVQNGQGMAVLHAAGHRPPMNQVTLACGAMSLPSALLGGVSTCLTGPTNALLTASGERSRHYAAAAWCGLLAIALGVLAPGMVRLMLATPAAFIAVLGGLAMLRALQGAFATAFSGPFSTGALVCFLVTVANVTALNIGSSFWGLVVGLAVARLLDAANFRA
ncbi:benzoate/H(+) symporter BenE family transporter [Pedococcus sp. P5_B7]